MRLLKIDTIPTRSRALGLKDLRRTAIKTLYPTGPGGGGRPDPLVTLANTFTRYASTQETAYDNGASRSSGTAPGNLLERQVERAMAQVMGRSPGRSGDSFRNALNGTFPTNQNGQVNFSPARSTVSLIGQDGATSAPLNAAGLAGQISSEQANLYRQALIVGGDGVKVLEGLQAFAPEAETDQVEALRALVRTQINVLIEEFGRVDEPRGSRVQAYLDALLGPGGHLEKLGRRALLDGTVPPATLDDESQIAGFALLRSYVGILREVWTTYDNKKASFDYPLFGDRLARAGILLPVIADGNNNLMSAMDSIGFTEAERSSTATRFSELSDIGPGLVVPGGPTLDLPDMTVNDLTDWLDRFASIESPSVLSDSGQYGLMFVTDQADRLFWIIVAILGYTKTVDTLNLNGLPVVAQVLLHERVSWALDDLVNQLRSLADLAA